MACKANAGLEKYGTARILQARLGGTQDEHHPGQTKKKSAHGEQTEATNRFGKGLCGHHD